MSRPIANNLQLGPLDDFACRQLDRIGGGGGGGNVHTQKNDEHSDAAARRGDDDDVGAAARDESPQDRPHDEVAVQNVGPRSRWQTVLVEAGGLGAAVSEESLKSLRYCLQWLVVSCTRPPLFPRSFHTLTLAPSRDRSVCDRAPRPPNLDPARFHPLAPRAQPDPPFLVVVVVDLDDES